ncbi:hypothetical protein Asp14428_68600 [Actinoplanes sp. NBRC 14428]|nr:hypothetical protein Asp14428_68600 [Actinoplanes sp. NBRC 14428]
MSLRLQAGHMRRLAGLALLTLLAGTIPAIATATPAPAAPPVAAAMPQGPPTGVDNAALAASPADYAYDGAGQLRGSAPRTGRARGTRTTTAATRCR